MNGFNISSASDIYYGGNLVKWVYIGNKKVWDYKTPPVYTAPTAKAGLIYNGSAQALLNAGSTSHGTIQYSSDGSTWGTSIPTSTNASNAITVYWRLVGDGRHNDVGPTEITATISNKDLTITAKAQTITYGNSIATGTGQVTVSGLVSGDSLTNITLTASRTDAGAGVIYPSAASTTKGLNNYNTTYNSGALTINKANQTLSVSSASVNSLAKLGIGERLSLSITHSPSTSNGGGSLSVTSSNTSVATTSRNTVTGVAVGNCKITVTKQATNNYNAITKTLNCMVVQKGTMEITAISGDITAPGGGYTLDYELFGFTGADEYKEFFCTINDGSSEDYFNGTLIQVYIKSTDLSGNRLRLELDDSYNVGNVNIEWEPSTNEYIVSTIVDDPNQDDYCWFDLIQEDTDNIFSMNFLYNYNT